MDLRDLKYFQSVASKSSIRRASEQLNISPASLTKAVQRLEEELDVALISHKGRQIEITPVGRQLESKANDLLQLEAAIRHSISGKSGDLSIAIGGEEILLSYFGSAIVEKLLKKYSINHVQFLNGSDKETFERIERREIQLAVSTAKIPAGLLHAPLENVAFTTVVGKAHPLAKRAKQQQSIAVDELLKYEFVAPEHAILGNISEGHRHDGWRDDKFPRRLKYRAASLSIIEGLLRRGLAVAYLPHYYAQHIGAVQLNVTGCPYSCHQQVNVLTKAPLRFSWLREIFG